MTPVFQHPPRLATRILATLVDADDRADVLGDLAERFGRRASRDGWASARRWYWKEAGRFAFAHVRELSGRLHTAFRPRRSHRKRVARIPAIGTLSSDIRYAVRCLLRTPVFTITVLITVGLGIGGTTAAFSAVHAVLIKPLPYNEPDRLFRVYRDHPAGRFNLSVVGYNAIREQSTHAQAVAAWANRTVTLNSTDLAERVSAVFVTPGYFSVLGIVPLHGRVFVEEDAVVGAERTVVVGYGFARSRFGGVEDAVGETILLDGDTYAIVGVLPALTGPLQHGAELFAAFQLEPPERKGPFFLRTVVRLRPGASPGALQDEVSAIQDRIFPIWAWSDSDASVRWRLESLDDYVVQNAGRRLWILLGVVVFVLLIASTNAANLLVARGTQRGGELAVRAALGASRGRLLQHLLAESIVLAVGCALLSLGLAALAVGALSSLPPDMIPRAEEISLSVPVLQFLMAVTAGSLILFGVVPALQLTGRAFDERLHVGARSIAGGLRSRTRRLLVASQFAVAVPLLIGAGLLLTSFVRLQRVDPGFESDHLLTVQLSFPNGRYDRSSIMTFWDDLETRLEGGPAIASAGVATGRPPDWVPFINNFNLIDQPTPIGETQPAVPFVPATAEYFETLGIPLIRGRLFDDRDQPEGPPVALVDQAWAHRFYAGEEAIGRVFTEGGCDRPDCPRYTVVGIVGDVKYQGLDDEGAGVIYVPYTVWTSSNAFLFARTVGDPLSALAVVRAAVREMDPLIPMSRLATGDELMRDAVVAPRNFLTLVGVFASVALLLAAIGIYGVMAYFVQEHSREIGIRLALGGAPGTMVRLIVVKGMRLVVAGVVVGTFGAVGLTRLLHGVLYDVGVTDPMTYATVGAGTLVIACLACLIPARRAAATDPATPLREA